MHNSSKINSEVKSMKIKERKPIDKWEFKLNKKIVNELNNKEYLEVCGSKKSKRCFSNVCGKNKMINNSLKSSKTSSVKKENKETFCKQIKAQSKIFSKQNSQDHHFLTVAELQSAEQSPKQQSKHSEIENNSGLFTNHKYQKENTLKNSPNQQSRQQYGVQVSKQKMLSPQQLQAQLDSTIDKLKSKQNTITILNKTIQTKLVESAQQLQKQKKYTNRLDAYEVEINFYIDKISQLQKELYEKNKLVKALTNKTMDFDTVIKNNKKIINENSRLRQEKEIMEKENLLLKKIINRKYQKIL